MHLAAGGSARVTFPLSDESFSLFDGTGARRVFPGVYTVYVDGRLPDGNSQHAAVEILQ